MMRSQPYKNGGADFRGMRRNETVPSTVGKSGLIENRAKRAMKIAHLTNLTDLTTSRRAFRRQVRRAGGTLEAIPYPARGPDGKRLFVDIGYIGPGDPETLAVVVTGIHGVEGPCGSVCLVDGLQSGLFRDAPAGTAFLLVHSLNPWGYAWGRRVNENGVDLNRNFRNHRQAFDNGDYREIEHLAVPRRVSTANTARFLTNLGWYLVTRGREKTERMLLGGQRSDPLGLYYAGMRAEPSAAILARILRRYARRAGEVVYFDVHSGLGDFGEMVLLHGYGESDRRRALAPLLWEAERHDASPGDSILFVDRFLKDRARFSGTLEFGTRDELTVLLALRAEHAVHKEIAAAEQDSRRTPELKALLAAARDRLGNAFAPRAGTDRKALSEAWTRTVAERFRAVVGNLPRLRGARPGAGPPATPEPTQTA